MSFFGVQSNAQFNRILYDIRLTLAKNQYLPNLRTIYRSCASLDPNQSGWLAPAHFEKALNENGIFLKKYELQVFEKLLSHQGTIGWFAFIAQMREPLSLARGRTLDSIWSSLDSSNTGKVHFELLSQRFDASQFKQFKLGYKSKDKILHELLDLVSLDAEGYVTYDQFLNFYTDLSINIPSDDIFNRFVCAQWRHSYNPGPATKAEEVKSALRTIRFKLLQRTNNTHEQFILRKIFNEFDINKNGKLTASQLAEMLLKLQIPVEERLLQGVVSKIAKSNQGDFDFEDLAQFVFYDPYHI